jgi:hypothetical protein
MKVVLIEDKKSNLATQNGAWKAALKQLEEYTTEYRGTNDKLTTYGMVNIGSYTRFYEMRPKSKEWVDFASSVAYDTRYPLEACQDEAIIHALLIDLETKTRRCR